MADYSDDEAAAVRRGLHHIYHGDAVDREARYAVREGALPEGLSGRGYFTVIPYEGVFNRASLASSPHMLSSPGRLLTVDLDPLPDASVRVAAHFLPVQSMHIRGLAPNAVVRSDFAEVSWLGVMNLANTTPVPVFPVEGADGRTGRRMVVSYDAGRPTEIDPRGLSEATVVGRSDQYRAAVQSSFSPMIMTSGHPVYDPEFYRQGPRLVYTHLVPWVADFFSRSQRSIRAELALMVWDGDRPPSQPLEVRVDGQPVLLEHASAHQINVTHEHLVIFNANLVLNTSALAEPILALLHKAVSAERAGLTRAVVDRAWQWVTENLRAPVPTASCPVFVIRKAALQRALHEGASSVEAQRFEIEGELTHAVADLDDLDGRITVFAQHNIGADPADPVQRGDRLMNGGVADADLQGLFTGSTDLNQVRRHVLDLATGTVESAAFPHPDDAASFKYGVNLLPPCQPLMYARHDAPGLAGDLTRACVHLDTTFWVAGGWLPDVQCERVFDSFRAAQHPRLVPEAEFRRRLADREHTCQIYALDRDLRLAGAFAFPVGFLTGAPLWVPKPGSLSTRDGWLVATVWGPDRAHVEIWVFDAGRIGDGPVCKLGPREGEAGVRPGFPLHNCWVDREGVEAWRPAERREDLMDMPAYVKVVELGLMGSSVLLRGARQLWSRGRGGD